MHVPSVDRFSASLDAMRSRATHAEKVVLSTVLVNGRSSYLPPAFEPSHPPHKIITAIIRTVPDHEDCGITRVWRALQDRGQADEVGVVLLAEITDVQPLPPHPPMLAELAAEISTTWARYHAAVTALQEAEGALRGVAA